MRVAHIVEMKPCHHRLSILESELVSSYEALKLFLIILTLGSKAHAGFARKVSDSFVHQFPLHTLLLCSTKILPICTRRFSLPILGLCSNFVEIRVDLLSWAFIAWSCGLCEGASKASRCDLFLSWTFHWPLIAPTQVIGSSDL